MDPLNMDPFWNHVVKMDDGSMECEFCEHPFSKGTSISRIKWPLSGEKGHGVAICTGQVPKDVQDAAFLAMRGGNKRQKTIASFSNVNDNAILSCPQEGNTEAQYLAGDVGRIQMAVQDTEQGVGEMAVQDTEQGVGEGRTSSHAEAAQAQDLVGPAIGRSCWRELSFREKLEEDWRPFKTGNLFL